MAKGDKMIGSLVTLNQPAWLETARACLSSMTEVASDARGRQSGPVSSLMGYWPQRKYAPNTAGGDFQDPAQGADCRILMPLYCTASTAATGRHGLIEYDGVVLYSLRVLVLLSQWQRIWPPLRQSRCNRPSALKWPSVPLAADSKDVDGGRLAPRPAARPLEIS